MSLNAWHDVTNLKFIIYLIIFQWHFYLSLFHTLYFMSIPTYISCIVHDLSVLWVVWKVQVMTSLQVADLFTVGS